MEDWTAFRDSEGGWLYCTLMAGHCPDFCNSCMIRVKKFAIFHNTKLEKDSREGRGKGDREKEVKKKEEGRRRGWGETNSREEN